MKIIPPHALLDALLKVQNIKNDAQLARELKMGAPILSKMRRHGTCTNDFRIAVLRRYNWTLAGIDKLAPPAAKD